MKTDIKYVVFEILSFNMIPKYVISYLSWLSEVRAGRGSKSAFWILAQRFWCNIHLLQDLRQIKHQWQIEGRHQIAKKKNCGYGWWSSHEVSCNLPRLFFPPTSKTVGYKNLIGQIILNPVLATSHNAQKEEPQKKREDINFYVHTQMTQFSSYHNLVKYSVRKYRIHLKIN